MKFLPFIQIGISILLIGGILLQQRGGGLSATFGGGDGGIYRTRRGVEKFIYRTTIVLAVLFFVTAVASIIVR